MIDSLIKLVDVLLGQRDRLAKADAERRKQVSLYFENVSRSLADIAKALRNEEAPWQACQELDEYSHWCDKQSSVAKIFGEDLANQISGELFGLMRSRGGVVYKLLNIKSAKHLYLPSFDSRESIEDFLEESIINFEKAAGKFKALSVMAAALDS